MSIRRAPRPQSNYHLLDKRISEDRRLSWAALGMMHFIEEQPPGWKLTVDGLIDQTPGTRINSRRDAVYAILNELIDAGYLRHEMLKDDQCRFAGGSYVILDVAGLVS